MELSFCFLRMTAKVLMGKVETLVKRIIRMLWVSSMNLGALGRSWYGERIIVFERVGGKMSRATTNESDWPLSSSAFLSFSQFSKSARPCPSLSIYWCIKLPTSFRLNFLPRPRIPLSYSPEQKARKYVYNWPFSRGLSPKLLFVLLKCIFLRG